MDHELYETWLFSLDPLSPHDAHSLAEHLQECESCRLLAGAWRVAEKELRSTPLLEPLPGFAGRWQARLASDRTRLHRRQTMALLVLATGVAAILTASLVLLTWPLMLSPGLTVMGWSARLLTFATYMDIVQSFLRTLLGAMSSTIPPVGWVFFAGILTELAVLWVVSYRWLTNPRRAFSYE